LVLSDRSIKEEIACNRIGIDPFDETAIQPASVDLHLDRKFRLFRSTAHAYVDIREEMPDLTELVEVEPDKPFILHPGEFVLGGTVECITLPDDIVARVDGRSSLGRLGLLIHSTAGFIDPGWEGCLTLELSNVSNLPITLYYGMRIGQISFYRMTSPAENPYGSEILGSKYKGQREPTPSRLYQEFSKDDPLKK